MMRKKVAELLAAATAPHQENEDAVWALHRAWSQKKLNKQVVLAYIFEHLDELAFFSPTFLFVTVRQALGEVDYHAKYPALIAKIRTLAREGNVGALAFAIFDEKQGKTLLLKEELASLVNKHLESTLALAETVGSTSSHVIVTQYVYARYYDDDHALESLPPYILQLAEQGYPLAQNYMGCYYQWHLNDSEQAAYYFELAAEKGYCSSQYSLGKHYFRYEKYGLGLQWCLQASNQGYPKAQLRLGEAFEFAYISTKPNYRLAASYYLLAAKQGDACAHYRLGYLHDSGCLSPSKDYKAMVFHYSKAEQGGIEKASVRLAEAQYQLGCRYEMGKKVRQSYALAARYYKSAIARKHLYALYNLGRIYERGCGVEKNLWQAMVYYRESADGGDVRAQYKMGLAYETGKGAKRDLARAIPYYLKAANGGHAGAQYKVGCLYGSARGVEYNYKKAIQYLGLAAKQKHFDARHKLMKDYGWEPEAQYTVGSLYSNAYGVPRHLGRAMMWYHKASIGGHASAKLALENLTGATLEVLENRKMKLPV